MPTAISSTARAIEPGWIREVYFGVEAVGGIDHRFAAFIAAFGSGMLALHRKLHLAQPLDEAREARVHRSLQALL